MRWRHSISRRSHRSKAVDSLAIGLPELALIGLTTAGCVSVALLAVAAVQRRRHRRTGRPASVTPSVALSFGAGASLLGVSLIAVGQAFVKGWQDNRGRLLLVLMALAAGALGLRELRRWWLRHRMVGQRREATVQVDLEPVDAPAPERYVIHCDKDRLALFGVLVGLLGLGEIAFAAFGRPFDLRAAIGGFVDLLIAAYAIKRVRDPLPDMVLDATGIWHRVHGSIAWKQIHAVRAESLAGRVRLFLDLHDESAWWARRPWHRRALRSIGTLRGSQGLALGRTLETDAALGAIRRFLAHDGSRD